VCVGDRARESEGGGGRHSLLCKVLDHLYSRLDFALWFCAPVKAVPGEVVGVGRKTANVAGTSRARQRVREAVSVKSYQRGGVGTGGG
jgi:hypothetical protein